MIKETFTTFITFTSGDSHVENPIPAERVLSTITRLCDGPAAQMGMIKRVIIYDNMDRVCVEIEGRDIVYPEALRLKQRYYRNNNGSITNKNNLGGE